jgi:hypothetical protein
MPEITELWNFYLYLFFMISKYLLDLPVEAFWADLTKCESDTSGDSGKPTKLDHLSGLRRGSGALKGSLWPPPHIVPALANDSSPEAFQEAGLKIKNVYWHPRNVILDLGPVYFSVSLFCQSAGYLL